MGKEIHGMLVNTKEWEEVGGREGGGRRVYRSEMRRWAGEGYEGGGGKGEGRGSRIEGEEMGRGRIWRRSRRARRRLGRSKE